MPPLNIVASRATVIASIPYSIVVSAADVQSSPGTDHPLWWVFTNEDNQLISFNARGSLAGVIYPIGHALNVPKIQLFTGTPDSLTPYPPTLGISINDPGPVQVGFLSRPTTFYIKITVHPTSEAVDDPVAVSVLPGRNITADGGSYIILSDESLGQDFPAMVFGADGQLKQSPTFVPSEIGYMFDDGTYAILNKRTSPEQLNLYRPDASLITVVEVPAGGGALGGDVVSGDGTSTVFVAKSDVTTAAVVTEVNKDTGAIGASWTLPADSKFLYTLSPTRDKTLLYYQGGTSTAVHRYDLIGDAPLSDLVADDVAFNGAIQGVFVLKDGSIAVAYTQGFIGGIDKIVRFDSAGSILNTYIVPGDVLMNMFSPYIDDPASLLVWTFDATGVLSRFFLVDTTTGVFTQLGADVPIFANGIYVGDQSNAPPTFGIPNSCPLLVPRVPLEVPDTPPTVKVTAPTPCCDARPGGGPNPGPVEEAPPYTWIAQCPGGGLVPTAADIENSEDWAA